MLNLAKFICGHFERF